MHKAIKILSLLLVVQLGLVILNNIKVLEKPNAKAGDPWIAIDWSALNTIELSDQTDTLTLSKHGEDWRLPNYFDLRTNTSKISELLKKLEDLSQDWPVGQTVETRKRFEVAANNYQRKISFKQDDKVLTTLLTGTSPGFRKVHARLDGHDEIYAISLSNFEISTDAKSWIDRQLLRPNLDKVTKIELKFPNETDNVSVEKTDDQWQLTGLNENKTARQDRLDLLMNDIKQISVDGALGAENDPDYQQQTPTLSVIFTQDDETTQWVFSEPKKGAHVVIKSSSHPIYFQLTRVEAEKFTLKQLNTLTETTVKTETSVVVEQPEINSQPKQEQQPEQEPETETETETENQSDDQTNSELQPVSESQSEAEAEPIQPASPPKTGSDLESDLDG